MDSEAPAFFPYFYFSPRRARDLFSATRLSQLVTVLGHGHRSATAKSTITSLLSMTLIGQKLSTLLSATRLDFLR